MITVLSVNNIMALMMTRILIVMMIFTLMMMTMMMMMTTMMMTIMTMMMRNTMVDCRTQCEQFQSLIDWDLMTVQT